jgi:sugar-specific transcriptional regulator TrmB
LNKLLDKNIILAIDSEPVRYTPFPPNEIIMRLRGKYLQTFDELGKGLNEVYQSDATDNQYIWNVNGRAEILRRIIQIINEAHSTIYLSIWDEEVTDLKNALRKAHARNVKMTIVHYGTKWLHFGQEYRHGREHQIRQQRGARRIALEVDDKKVILAHFLENNDSHALWTNNKGFVLLAKDYIIHDIYTIRMAEKFGADAIEIFESH